MSNKILLGALTGAVILQMWLWDRPNPIEVQVQPSQVQVQPIIRNTSTYQTYEITAYTAGRESTGKSEGHPQYGITASGTEVLERRTLACPPSLAFGTRVYIPAFETVFTCEDRGSDITEGRLDVYMASLRAAEIWGRQTLKVFILPEEE